jgi:hypothetical protein
VGVIKYHTSPRKGRLNHAIFPSGRLAGIGQSREPATAIKSLKKQLSLIFLPFVGKALIYARGPENVPAGGDEQNPKPTPPSLKVAL